MFRAVIKAGKVRPLQLPARSPNLNALRALGTIGERGVHFEADFSGRARYASPNNTLSTITKNATTKGKRIAYCFRCRGAPPSGAVGER